MKIIFEPNKTYMLLGQIDSFDPYIQFLLRGLGDVRTSIRSTYESIIFP